MTAASNSGFSGDTPSPRYHQLVQAYRQMHDEGAPDLGIPAAAMFPGQSLAEHAGTLLALTRRHVIRTMLDYGCGKAMLYRPGNDIRTADGRRATCLQELLGVDITLYDPGYLPFAEKPAGRFDLVVCTDVLEHCAQVDLPWIIDELFSFARRYVFANVACYPARKTLPNGENAHCTVQPAHWWRALVENVALRHPEIDYQFVCTFFDAGERVTATITRA